MSESFLSVLGSPRSMCILPLWSLHTCYHVAVLVVDIARVYPHRRHTPACMLDRHVGVALVILLLRCCAGRLVLHEGRSVLACNPPRKHPKALPGPSTASGRAGESDMSGISCDVGAIASDTCASEEKRGYCADYDCCETCAGHRCCCPARPFVLSPTEHSSPRLRMPP